MPAPAIGIDLGTTFSCVGVFQHGKIEIIPNNQGNRITPSYVAFNDFEILIGEDAKSQAELNPINTVFDVKRLIGRKYNDLTVQNDIKHWPFNVKDNSGNPIIEVEYKKETKSFTPEEISAKLLQNLKELAESYLGVPIRDAVITVPAYFNDSQRQATKDAGTIAGLNVLRILNEPTAAAVAYSLDNISNTLEDTKVLIFDLGGGTFDVSILNIRNGIIEVLSTNGDTHFGGEDFDNKLVDYFVNEFKQKYEKDLMNSKRSLRRLKTACEKAKRTLSISYQANINIDSLYEEIPFSSTISRSIFEELCAELFKCILEPVKMALSDAKLDKSVIQQIILVGGSTRIPKVQQLLQEYFGGKELNKSINPNEAIGHGAAVQAAMLNGEQSKEIKYLLLLDIAPLSLGIATTGGEMSTIIKRNTSIPQKIEEVYSCPHDDTESLCFRVYEGEGSMVNYNNLLGKFSLEGIAPAPKGSNQIKVTFDIDPNSIITASAIDTNSGNSNKIIIKNEKGRLSKEELDRMVQEAEKHNEDTKHLRKIIIAKNTFQSLCFHIKSSLEVTGNISKLLQEEVANMKEEIIRTISWTNSNINSLSNEDFEQRQTIINNAWDQLKIKLKSESSNLSLNRTWLQSLRNTPYNFFLRTKQFIFGSPPDKDV